MFEKIIEASNFLLNNFSEAERARDYLNLRLKKESQDDFQFGYFPTIEHISALTSIIGEDTLIENNLLYFKEIEDSLYPRKIKFSFFEDHPLIMPYKDAYGNIVGIVGRSLLSDNERQCSKYKNTNFSKSKHLFGLFENKKSIIDKGCVFIVEGQFDTIKAKECGFDNIVSIGSSNLSEYQFSIITRYTNNINLLLDNDDAGEKGRKRILDKFSNYANILSFYIPEEYKDIDEFLSKNKYDSLSFTIRS